MRIRFLFISLVLLVAAIAASAQDQPPSADDPAATEQPDEQDSAARSADSDDADTAEPVLTRESESGEPGLDTFKPSEEISADRSVAFPNDI